MDDVKTDTAYASNPIKLSHERAMSRKHPATLLPDSGAVEKLIGAQRATAVHKEAIKQGLRPTWTKLKMPKLVYGVGGTAQFTVEGQVSPKLSIQYTAPLIEGDSSGVPALLGLEEQARARCILLPNAQEMKIWPSHCTETQISWPSGTRTVNMEQYGTVSGSIRSPLSRLLLPFLQHWTKHDGSCRDSNHSCHYKHEEKSVLHSETQAIGETTQRTPMPPVIVEDIHYPMTMAQERPYCAKEYYTKLKLFFWTCIFRRQTHARTSMAAT
eukprot:347158-Amphidinium_carterae.1